MNQQSGQHQSGTEGNQRQQPQVALPPNLAFIVGPLPAQIQRQYNVYTIIGTTFRLDEEQRLVIEVETADQTDVFRWLAYSETHRRWTMVESYHPETDKVIWSLPRRNPQRQLEPATSDHSPE